MNSQQAAYQANAATFDNGWREVRNAIEKGLHAVVCVSPAYCPSTDAPMGNKYDLIESCATLEAAQAALGKAYGADPDEHDPDASYQIFPRPTPTEITPFWTEEDELSF